MKDLQPSLKPDSWRSQKQKFNGSITRLSLRRRKTALLLSTKQICTCTAGRKKFPDELYHIYLTLNDKGILGFLKNCFHICPLNFSIIRISNVKKEDAGTYEVCAKNREGEATNTLVLNVKAKESKAPVAEIKDYAPIITEPLTATMCKVGEKVMLETVITGKPRPDLEWTFDGERLISSQMFTDAHRNWLQQDVKIVEKDNIYTLIIDKAKQSHDGQYLVKAKNSLGTVQTSANISVEADKMIEFVKPLEDVEIKEKDVIEMDVELSTDEVSNVKWFKDGEAIDTQKKKEKYEVKKVGRKQSLKIINATVHDEGEYTAAVGEQESTCELTVVGKYSEFVK